VVFAAFSDFLLGIAAVITAIATFLTAWYGIQRIRKDAHQKTDECHQRLAEAYAEAERLASELHTIRMGQIDNPKESES
jgi:hypothetical protein